MEAGPLLVVQPLARAALRRHSNTSGTEFLFLTLSLKVCCVAGQVSAAVEVFLAVQVSEPVALYGIVYVIVGEGGDANVVMLGVVMQSWGWCGQEW